MINWIKKQKKKLRIQKIQDRLLDLLIIHLKNNQNGICCCYFLSLLKGVKYLEITKLWQIYTRC